MTLPPKRLSPVYSRTLERPMIVPGFSVTGWSMVGQWLKRVTLRDSAARRERAAAG